MKRSSTSGPTFVTTQAIRALWPRITAGTPGKLTPSTSYGQAAETPRQRRPFMYQMPGIWIPRCGSLARSAWPVALLDGATGLLRLGAIASGIGALAGFGTSD